MSTAATAGGNENDIGTMEAPGTARQQFSEPRQDRKVAAVSRFSGRCSIPGIPLLLHRDGLH